MHTSLSKRIIACHRKYISRKSISTYPAHFLDKIVQDHAGANGPLLNPVLVPGLGIAAIRPDHCMNYNNLGLAAN